MTRGIYTSNVNHTATYSALMSQNGDYHMAVGDMNIHKVITPDNVSLTKLLRKTSFSFPLGPISC